ncbi:MAG: outer membrane beta-barrel protein [Candidatus Aminicenantes bacterium]|nr:outer membrane beta-barrel protein [Candidatus Aminicenantes bacterium]
MKRIGYGLAVGLLVAAAPAAAGVANRFSLKLTPGGVTAVDGRFNDAAKTSAVVNVGAGLAAAVRYRFNDFVCLEAGYGFAWLSVKKDQRPFDYKEGSPALNIQTATLNATVFLSSGFAIDPYLTAGLGVYPWRFSRTALWGDAWPAPSKPSESFGAVSPGFNAGIGAEAYLFGRVYASAELKYHFLFARNPAKFGTDDFTQQDFAALTIGLVYRFGRVR